MKAANLFVGAVASVLGLVFLGAAIFNWNWWYELSKTRWLVVRIGRTAARLTLGVLGIALIALGVAVARGFRWPLF